jgi:hypothetical protein
MTPSLLISEQERRQIVKRATTELVAHLIAEHKDAGGFISPTQAAGMLDINSKTLLGIPRKDLPRYEIVAGKVIRYKLTEVLTYINTTKQ